MSFHGSTPVATEEPDFLTSADPWFRPVDLRMGPDRALYVADFYNKVIGHYEVPLEHPGRDKERGRIWRIVKSGLPAGAEAVPDEIAALRFEARAGKLPEASLEKVRRWLKSADPFEKRAAVEALIRPVSTGWLPDLLAALPTTAADDEALRHQLRIVIREHLKLPDAFAEIDGDGFSAEVARELSNIARAVNSPAAARYLLERLKHQPQELPELVKSLAALATRLPAGELLAFSRERFADDPGAQADLLGAIADGVRQRGELPGSELTSWGNELATSLLEASAPSRWTIVMDPASPVSPWTLQTRSLATGGEIQLISSLDGAGEEPESRMGTLRSEAFKVPASFSFVLCGHSGEPGNAAHPRNFVRLIDDATGAELHRAQPPRNDAAHRIQWDLTGHAGKPVRFEITDGDAGAAYAWLAVGGFDPPLLTVASFSADSARTARLSRLAMLLKYAAPAGLRERLAAYLPAPAPPPPSPVTPEMRAELDKLILARTTAFQSAAAAKARGPAIYATYCAACHAVGGKGALIGPQLDGIGNRGAARLIEDILDPGRNVDAHFRLHFITRKDGSIFAGLERGQVGELLICVDAAGQEHRLPKAEIEKNEETGLSLMPPGFGQAIPEADFHHLLAWLLDFK